MWDYLKSRHMRRLERKVDQIMADIKDLKPILDGIKDDVGVVQTGIGSLQTKLQTVSDALAAAQAAGAVIPADVHRPASMLRLPKPAISRPLWTASPRRSRPRPLRPLRLPDSRLLAMAVRRKRLGKPGRFCYAAIKARACSTVRLPP
jgi:hypothetical protein